MEGESPKPTNTPTGAVFLSYASQDAQAAQRIADSLRTAGIEVWFDQSELRGGDAWDQKIRKQIKTCALFIPVISHATHDRREGYFRLEWKLAVDRSHLMDAELPFLLPVVIDDTRDDDERVPDRFREVQWTRLPGGQTTPAFVERVQRLLAPTPPVEPAPPAVAVGVSAEATRDRSHRAAEVYSRTGWLRSLLVVAVLMVFAGGAYVAWEWLAPAKRAAPKGLVNDKSIAVLPFVDMSEKHDQEYFTDGMAEEILDSLAKIPELRVIARTSSFQFKSKAEDVRKIGQELNAAYIVEGSVRRSGDQIRVTAQLIDSRDGAHRWSDSYNAKMDDV